MSDASDVEGAHTRTFHHCSTCATSAWNALRSLAIVVVKQSAEKATVRGGAVRGKRGDARGVVGVGKGFHTHMNVFEPGTDRMNVFTRLVRHM